MTLDELRDLHARRDRWLPPGTELVRKDGTTFTVAAWTRQVSDGHYEHNGYDDGGTGLRSVAIARHPFPATLDAADASFPPKWRWTREWTENAAWWAAFPKRWDGEEYPSVPDTGDKIHDLYALSKLAWEQEAA